LGLGRADKTHRGGVSIWAKEFDILKEFRLIEKAVGGVKSFD